MTYGFEREYFVQQKNTGKFVSAADVGLPHDGCGYLAEARGEPHKDPLSAHYLLRAAERKLEVAADQVGCVLIFQTPQKLDKKFLHECMRKHGKGQQTDFSMSGKWNKSGVQHAGMHIHFGNIREFQYKTGPNQYPAVHTTVDMINIPKIVLALDKMYARMITNAKRAPGLYKMTSHGFEYRSLPAAIYTRDIAEYMARKPEIFR